MRLAAALTLAVAVVLAVPAGAGAVVPPTDCDFIRVEGKRYNIKTHRLTCKTARSYARTYLAHNRRPRGWRCKRYKDTSVVFRCTKSRSELFGIRR